MHLYEFNQASDKPLINLAYANGFPPETYRHALTPLFDKYHVVSIQLRPLWGDSQPESLTKWAQFGDDLLASMAELTDQPIIAIGHSFGAVATMYAAVKRPERFRYLILIEPTLLPPHLLLAIGIIRALRISPRNTLVEGALRRRRTWDSTEAAYEYFRTKRLFARWPDSVLHTYAESITAPDDTGKVNLTWSPEWESQIYRTLPTDVWSLPSRLNPPTLVIRAGHSDAFFSFSPFLFRFLNPRTVMETVHDAGHLVPQEQPETVGKLITNFLQPDR